MNYYDICCRHKGKVVQIKEKNGRLHVGKIVDVDPTYVWLERTNERNGFGYGYYGGQGQYGYYGYNSYNQYGGYGGRGPYPYHGGYGGNPYFFPVALAGIGGFALGAAFFW